MRISEVAGRSGVSSRMLRYYDKLGLLTPSGRTPAGYREYTEHDLLRLLRVEGLRTLGLTLQQVSATLEVDAPEPEALIAELLEQSRDRLDRGLESAQPDDRLRAALAAAGSAALPEPALVSALLDEDDLNAAGALRWALAQSADGPSARAARGPRAHRGQHRGRRLGRASPKPSASSTRRGRTRYSSPCLRIRTVPWRESPGTSAPATRKGRGAWPPPGSVATPQDPP